MRISLRFVRMVMVLTITFYTSELIPRNSWWSSVVMFLVHGLVVATWVSRIPAIQAALRLTNGTLGLALLGAAVGSVIAIPFCGWLVVRFGSKAVTTLSTFAFCFAPLAIGCASDF